MKASAISIGLHAAGYLDPAYRAPRTHMDVHTYQGAMRENGYRQGLICAPWVRVVKKRKDRQ